MNRIYRIVWNAATGRWMVVSELAKGRKKKAALRLSALAVTLALPAAGALAADACTTPEGEAGTRDERGVCVIEETVASPSGIGLMGGLDGGIATGTDAVAVGPSSEAAGARAVAIGSGAKATNIANVAIGDRANTAGSNAVSMGYNATANGNYTLSLGGGSSAVGSRATAVGTDAAATGSNATALGNGSQASALFATALGNGAKATAQDAIATGRDAQASALYSIATGYAAQANQSYTIATGTQARALTSSSVALGFNATAGAADADGNPLGANQIALGSSANAAADSSVALGAGATVDVNAQYGTAIGRTARVTASGVNAIAIGQASVADRANTLSVGAVGAERQIVNVAAATLDTDAVNLSQLKATAGSVAAALGGGAAVDAAGQITAPNYTVGGVNHNNVGSALGNLDGRTTSNTTNLTTLQGDVSTLTTNVQNQFTTVNTTIGDLSDTVDNAVMYDGADKGTVSFGGADGTTLKNIAAGEVSEDSRDAVNGAQLHSTNQQVEQNTTLITDLDGRVTHIDNRVTQLEDGFNDGSIGLVRQDADNRDITVAAHTDGTRVNLAGTEGNRVVSGVAGGVADSDAVNVSQLKSTEQGIRDDMTGLIGDSLEGAVMYDGADKGSVSFGGADGTVLKNVAAGEVSEDSRDAVNGSQLHATNQQVEQNTTLITELDGRVTHIDNRVTQLEDGFDDGSIGLVRQDADSRDITVAAHTDGTRVNLAGTEGDRVVSGVAVGVADNDAVNVSQLKATGLIGEDGTAMNAVVYDSDALDSITLGGKDSTAAVKIKNVADATEDDEAVNLRQLKDAGLVGEGGQTLDAVTYDADSNRGQVTFAGVNGTLLTNVADGRITAGSRDAVNGGQIAALQDQLHSQISNIDNRVTHIEQNGGGSGGDDPYFDANGNPVSDVPDNSSAPGLPSSGAQAGGASAVAAGNGAVASGNASVAVGAGAKAEADNAVALGAGSVADRDDTVSVGRSGYERQITNVKAGVRDTDAVNVSQLNQRMAEANAYTDQRIDDVWQGVNDRIDHASRQANRGIASASAMIPVTPYMPGKTVLNAGMASYRGETALGVGISRWSDNGRVNLNAGVSVAQGDRPIFRVGVGVVLGD
ncbi:ESPR-type extended signal peptide-containing protein [Stenotrophomonas maltophilia]|uniref:ESPR-type extended signal peptide-containing protein n=1 Tax=Stenotrophomonas maltophilia TaxID=40324 RepID=UPI001C60DB98|nr:ESPR-type extended signal peptide-containing protein [Stenotrophomonas maltophilia]